MWNRFIGRLAATLTLVAGLVAAAGARADAPRPDGRTYAVLVGIANYPSAPLQRTDVDARRIATALQRNVAPSRLDVRLLLNGDATKQRVTAAVRDVVARATPRDEVIFFFSGHGSTQPDAQGEEGDGRDETLVLYDGELSDDELAALLRPLDARFSMVALDSCFAGGFLFDVANGHKRMGLFSSDEDLTSAVPSREAGGWLSLYLAEALEGRADGAADGVAGQGQDGQLTALEIELYIRDRFAHQRIPASDPDNRTVGYQLIQIQRVGVAPDSVLVNFEGENPNGVTRNVLFERPNQNLPNGTDFSALPRIPVQLAPGRSYVFETYDLGPATDTVLELRRATSGAPSPDDPVLAMNDDADGLASEVRHRATQGGAAYLLVRPYGPQTGGTFGVRAVELVPGPNLPAPATLVARDNLLLPPTEDLLQLPRVEMQLRAGETYVIETANLSQGADTVLELRRARATTPQADDEVLAENDDSEGLASRLRYRADRPGLYYAVVRPYSRESTGTVSLRVSQLTQGGRAPNAATPRIVPSPVTELPPRRPVVEPPPGPGPVPMPTPVPAGPAPALPGATVLEREGLRLPATDAFDALPHVLLSTRQGHTYHVETYDLADGADTVLELRRMVGSAPAESDPVVAVNDDNGHSLASRLSYTALTPGRFYAHVRPYAGQAGGAFSLRVNEAAGRARQVLERRLELPATMDEGAFPTVQVQLQAGRSYRIETFDLAPGADTVLSLESADGRTLAQNDDANGSLASMVTFTPTESGAFTVRVRPYAAGTGGAFGLRVVDLG